MLIYESWCSELIKDMFISPDYSLELDFPVVGAIIMHLIICIIILRSMEHIIAIMHPIFLKNSVSVESQHLNEFDIIS